MYWGLRDRVELVGFVLGLGLDVWGLMDSVELFGFVLGLGLEG